MRLSWAGKTQIDLPTNYLRWSLALLRVHTNYAQAVAVTGRLASNDPNLQNIPVRKQERRIREAFIAPGSTLFQRIIPRLNYVAHIYAIRLLRAFAAGRIFVRRLRVFGIPVEQVDRARRYAKVINFGLIYGMSDLVWLHNWVSNAALRVYIDRYFALSGVADYMQEPLAGKGAGICGNRFWANCGCQRSQF